MKGSDNSKHVSRRGFLKTAAAISTALVAM